MKVGPVTRRKSRDETRSRRQVTRRDETRDGLVQFVSRPKLTRRDEMRDQVHKGQNFTQTFDPNSDILVIFFLQDKIFSSRRSREMKLRDETRSRQSCLVSSCVFFETIPSRYRPYTKANLSWGNCNTFFGLEL